GSVNSNENTDEKKKEQPPTNGSGGKHPLKLPVDRVSLAPTSRDKTYHVIDPSINKIYHEARRLGVEGFERVSGVITRVFLELSCDLYLDKKSVPMPEHFARKSINRWADAKLREKLQKILECLDPDKKDNELTPIRRGLGSDDWLHSIGTLHSFVHDKLSSATANEVKTIWDRYHPLFKKIHESLSSDLD
ncbi:unnamed protein product, partial [Ectocarpus sp. 12 AP-2014]